jgi:hypothetical protein
MAKERMGRYTAREREREEPLQHSCHFTEGQAVDPNVTLKVRNGAARVTAGVIVAISVIYYTATILPDEAAPRILVACPHTSSTDPHKVERFH